MTRSPITWHCWLGPLAAVGLAACAASRPEPVPPPPVSAFPLTTAEALADGGLVLSAAQIDNAVRGRACSGESPAGLFEIDFQPGGTALLTPPTGVATTSRWAVDADGRLCQAPTGTESCDRLILLDGTLHLFDNADQHVATLVCG